MNSVFESQLLDFLELNAAINNGSFFPTSLHKEIDYVALYVWVSLVTQF